MADFHDLTVPSDDWVDINTSLSIADGTLIYVQNTGSVPVRLAEGATKPAVSKTRGFLMFPYDGKQTQSDPDGTQKTWAISTSDTESSTISVQT